MFCSNVFLHYTLCFHALAVPLSLSLLSLSLRLNRTLNVLLINLKQKELNCYRFLSGFISALEIWGSPNISNFPYLKVQTVSNYGAGIVLDMQNGKFAPRKRQNILCVLFFLPPEQGNSTGKLQSFTCSVIYSGAFRQMLAEGQKRGK